MDNIKLLGILNAKVKILLVDVSMSLKCLKNSPYLVKEAKRPEFSKKLMYLTLFTEKINSSKLRCPLTESLLLLLFFFLV